MAEPRRIPLVFGRGLDRATGVMATRPASFEDLRNVLLYEGKAQVRKGYSSTATLLDDAMNPVSHVVGGHALRTEQVGIVVGYAESDRELHVYRVSGLGTGPTRLGVWATLPAGADLPRVVGAESYSRVFLAHDEPLIGRRQRTIYYDPTGPSELNTLAADLDGDGTSEDILFRGVARHLNYIFGWGYGTGSDQARHEIVRVSLPGQPTVFRPEHYFIAGQRADPVVACTPAGSVLLVLKETESYEIFGYDRRSFGIRPADPYYGALAARLALTVGGIAYFWSHEGPRRSVGGLSEDLALPLDLGGPDPEGLVAEGAVEYAFAHYVPTERVILWIFGRRVYALSIRNPRAPEWSYWELGTEPFCAFTLYSGGVALLGPPTGFPAHSSVSNIAATSVTVEWTNNGAAGDELVEIWLKPAGGAWAQHDAVLVNGLPTQQRGLTGLQSGTDYEVAYRYRRGGLYAADYEGATPDAWAALSSFPERKGAFATGIDAPTLDSVTWSRVDASTEKHTLSWTNAQPDRQIEVYGRLGAQAYELLATVPAGTTSYEHTSAHGTTPLTGEANWTYKLRHIHNGNPGADSNELTHWAGPDAPTDLFIVDANTSFWGATWTNNAPGAATEIWIDDVLEYTSPVDAEVAGPEGAPVGWQAGNTASFKALAKLTSFTVDDFSVFTPPVVVTIEAAP